jgi:hypothetical protein
MRSTARRVRLDWPVGTAIATDVFGQHPPLRLDDRMVELELDSTPVFVSVRED